MKRMDEPRIHSVKFNVVMNMILTSSSVIFPLITVPYVSRVLSTYGTGIVAFAQSALTYFSLIALLGISSYGVRACASVRNDIQALSQTVKELLIILLGSTTIVFLGYVACVFLVPQFREQKMLFLIFGSGLWLASFGVEWLYQALEQYDYITIRNILIKVVCIVMMFAMVRQRDDYLTYGCIVVVAGYGANIFNIIRLRHIVDFSVVQKTDISRHFRPMLYFFLASASSGMYVQADTFLLGLLGTTNMVGLYQLVVKIKGTLITSVNSVGNVMLPRLSYYHAGKNDDKAHSLVAKTLNFSFLVSTAAILWCVLESDAIVTILGGPDFAASASGLIAIAPAIALSSLNSVLGNYMASSGKERVWALINVSGLIVALILNCILIPRYGIIGAALSSVGCEGFVLIIRTYQNRALLIEIRKSLQFLRIATAAGVGFVISIIISSVMPISNSFLRFMSETLVFCGIFGVLLLFFKEYFITQIFVKIRDRIQGVTR